MYTVDLYLEELMGGQLFLNVEVEFIICPAEPDVGIPTDYAEVQDWTATDGTLYVNDNQFEFNECMLEDDVEQEVEKAVHQWFSDRNLPEIMEEAY